MGQWEDGFRWISCDVTSLHSSIPHHLGIQADSYFLKKSGKFSLVLQEFILPALDYLLTYNFFMFDGGYYLQRFALIGQPIFGLVGEVPHLWIG